MALSKNSPIRVRAAQRRLEALRLREAGLTYSQIAEQMGVKRPTVIDLITHAMTALRNETAEEGAAFRQIELARLETIHREWAPLATPPEDPLDTYGLERARSAAAIVLKACERRAKLLGLDAPERRELTGADGRPLAAAVFAVPQPAPSVDSWEQSAKILPSPLPSTE